MNDSLGDRTKILLIAEYVGSVRAIASVRWNKLVKYLLRSNRYEIDVVTNAKCFDKKQASATWYEEDATLENDMLGVGKFFIMEDSLLLKALNCFYNRLHTRYASATSKQREESLSESGNEVARWVKKLLMSKVRMIASSSLKSLRLIGADQGRLPKDLEVARYDVIISSYGPRWPLCVASKLRRENPNVVWISDYRDPPSILTNSYDFKHDETASQFGSYADCSIGIASGIRSSLDASVLDYNVLTNGFDPEEMSSRNRVNNSFFEVVYTGNLYSGKESRRDLTPVFAALEELGRENEIELTKIKVVYVGQNESVFFDQAAGYPTVPSKCLGYVSRERAMALQDSASLLLLSTWNTETNRSVLTGKVFEYLSAGVPIVATCTGPYSGSEAKDIVERSGSGVMYEEATAEVDMPRLKAFIKEKYDQWIAGGITSCEQDRDYINQFSYPVLADKLAGIIDSLLEERKHKAT